MNIFDQLLADNQIPKFVRVRHEMDHSHIDDIEGAVAQAMRREGTLDRIKPGDSVCITAGSRDVANIARIIRAICDQVKSVGAHPFIIPAMGSHAGAKAEGQRGIIEGYGVTEEAMGAPIRASMDTEVIAHSRSGLEIHLDKFANAADFTFIFVGNVDPQSIRPDIERYIASLPGSAQKETARHIEFIVPGNRESRFDKEVSTPKATVVVTISGDERYSLKDQLEMTFLKQIMDIVYVETIRAEEGGTYGVSTQASLLREPYNRYAFTISFDTSNEKSEALADRALAELKKVGDEGPTAAAFDKVKEFLQKSYAQSIKENGYWLGQLTSFYRYGTDSHTEYLKTLNAITPEDIGRLARKIYDSPNRVEVVMNGIAKQE